MREGDVATRRAAARRCGAGDAAVARARRRLPVVAGAGFKRAVLQSFRDVMAANMNLSIFINLVFAGIIAFGVVYNAARVSLSERSRELASLRVLGFTRAEISLILLGELALLTLAALPVGGAVRLQSGGAHRQLDRQRGVPLPAVRLARRRWRGRFWASSGRRRCRGCWCGGGSIDWIWSRCSRSESRRMRGLLRSTRGVCCRSLVVAAIVGGGHVARVDGGRRRARRRAARCRSPSTRTARRACASASSSPRRWPGRSSGSSSSRAIAWSRGKTALARLAPAESPLLDRALARRAELPRSKRRARPSARRRQNSERAAATLARARRRCAASRSWPRPACYRARRARGSADGRQDGRGSAARRRVHRHARPNTSCSSRAPGCRRRAAAAEQSTIPAPVDGVVLKRLRESESVVPARRAAARDRRPAAAGGRRRSAVDRCRSRAARRSRC